MLNAAKLRAELRASIRCLLAGLPSALNRQLTGDCLGYSREGFRNVFFRQLFGAVATRVHVSGLPLLNCAV